MMQASNSQQVYSSTYLYKINFVFEKTKQFFLACVKGLFVVQYSDKNSPHRSEEEVTYMNFVDFLDECEGM